MKTSRYTEPQILSILRQAEGGVPVADRVLRTWHDVIARQWFVFKLRGNASFYKWRAR